MGANYQFVPDELRASPLWLQYYPSPDPKHPDKKPRKHPSVKYATPEDRKANLRPLDKLLERAATPGGGMQRWIDKAEGYAYIDVDRVRNPETGEVEQWALELIRELDTYCEISASGEGFHLVARATLPRDFHVDPDQVEIYAGNTSNKLMALTGEVFETYNTIQDRQDRVKALLQQHEALAFKNKVPLAAEVLPTVDESDDVVAEEPLPEFPRLVGPLHAIAEAITHDLPYEHKALALLTYTGAALSGRVRLTSDPWLQPRFYSCAVGPAGFGKTAVDHEVQTAMSHVGGYDSKIVDSVESGKLSRA